MARNITFKIITQAQTKELEALNRQLEGVRNTLNSLTKGQKKTIDKALGLDTAADDARNAVKHLRGVVDEIKEMGQEAADAKRKLSSLSAEEKELAQAAKKVEQAEERKAAALKQSDDAYDKLSKSTKNYKKQITDMRKAVKDTDSVLGKMEGTITSHMSQGLRSGSRDVETMMTKLRELRTETGKVDKAMVGMKEFPDEVRAAQKRLTTATNELAEAQSKLYSVRNKPDRSIEEIEEAQRALDRSKQSHKEAAAEVEKLDGKLRKFGSTVNTAERLLGELNAEIKANKLEDLIPPSAMRHLETLEDALRSTGRGVDAFGDKAIESFRKIQTGLGALGGRRTQLEKLSEELEQLRREAVALGKLDVDWLKQDMGNVSAAVRSASSDLMRQNKIVVDHISDLNRLAAANNKFGDAQREAARYAEQGTHSIREQQRINQLYAKSLAEARTVETGMRSRDKQLIKDKMELTRRQQELNEQIEAGRRNLERFSDEGSADYKRARRELDQLTEAYETNNRALQENENNARQNASALRVVGNVIQNIEADHRGFIGVVDRVKGAYDQQIAAAREAAQVQQRLSRERTTQAQRDAEFQRTIARENIRAIEEQNRQEQQRIRDQIRLEEQRRAAAERTAREQERLARRAADEAARQAARTAREEERAANQRIADLRRVQREQERIAREQRREQERLVREQTRTIDRLGAAGRIGAFLGGGPGGAGPIPANTLNVLRDLMNVIQRINRFAIQLSNTFGSVLRSAINAAANAARGFINSAGSMFAGLQRSLQGITNSFRNFGMRVARSMDQARASMLEFYAAGYSLLTVGSQIQQFGNMMFRQMGMGLETFMEYERARTQAGVAGAQAVRADGSIIPDTSTEMPDRYVVNSKIIDDIVFGLQRGTATPEWLGGGQGRPLPVQFDAKELAEGLYFYSSAIGAPITEQNQKQVSDAVATIMQMAQVTNTGIETATKGVLNVMMEFGYNPRDIGSESEAVREESAWRTAQTAAQMGYLANISSMEVSDIVETFKMVGPMAHLLSPNAVQGEAGAGLDETFMLAFLASEVGLRGSKVGRGINQAFTSLLDPTDKMLEIAGKYWGEGGESLTIDQFNELFKDESGALKGGIQGFLTMLSTTVDREDQTTMLAELLTTNATRSLMGPVVMSEDFDMGTWLTRIQQNPLKWLESAVAESANTISGWFTYMKNSWFQFSKSIIDSARGPLMNTFRMIGGLLFDFAEEIQLDPRIGQVIAGIVTAIASLATVLGTIAIAAGGILLMSRAFAMLGGMVGSIVRMVLMAGATLLGLIPLLIGLGVVIAGVRALWQSNFLGMREAFDNFREGMTIEDFTDSFVKGFINTFKVIGTTIDEFTRGILGGQGTTNNLFAFMQSFFGPLLGGQIIQGLTNLRNALEPTREAIRNFFDGVGESGASLEQIGLAIQGFFEQIFLGRQRLETAAAQNVVGRVFGIDNLSVHLQGAASTISSFVGSVVGYAGQIIDIWQTMVESIYGNIARALGGTDISSFFSSLGEIAAGVAQGIVLSFTLILGTVELITDKIADMAEALQKSGSAGKDVLGFTLTFDRALQALGITIGLVLGARLALAFGPFMGVVSRLIPLMTGMTAIVVGIGGRMLVLAANIAVTTAAWLAQLAVMGAVLLAKNALNIVNWMLAASSAALALAQGASVASGTANIGVMSILSGVGTLLSGAYTAVAAAATAAAAGTLTFTAVVGAAVAVVVALIAAFFMVVTALAAVAATAFVVAGGLLILVAATEGLGAAFAGAMEFASGLWAGLQPGLQVLQAIGDAIMTVADLVGRITGLGDGFRVLGFVAGAAISGIIIALTGLAVIITAIGLAVTATAMMMVASFLAPLVPFALLAAAVIGVIQLIKNFGDVWDWLEGKASSVGSAILDGWLMMTDGMELAFTQMADAVGGAMIDAMNSILDTLNKMPQGIKDLPGMGWLDLSDNKIPDSAKPNWSSSVEGRIQARNDIRERNNDIIAEMERFNSQMGQTAEETAEQSNKLMEALAVIGLDDDVRALGLKYDIDVDNAGFSDLQALFGELTKVPEMEQLLAETDFDYSVLGPSGESYQAAKSAWDDYQNRIKMMSENLDITVQEATRRVNESYAAMGMAIPVDPGSFDQWNAQVNGMADNTEEAAERIKVSLEDMTAALNEFYANMTLERSMDLFKNLEGMGDKETLGSTLMAVGDKILENAGDVPWLNMTELLMDATGGTAGSINTEMIGQNIHTALRPVLEHTARQLGVSVDSLLADVPKFMAPEGLVNFATAEFVRILDSMPQDVYSKLDTLGIAQGWNEFGMDWSELMTYGTGMAMQGLDWNLADYIAESYGIEVAAAEEALRAIGIDPDVISDEWLQMTEQAALTMDGQIQVLTAEMASMAEDIVNSADGMAIRLTESELRNLPDAVKIYLDSLGYVFITDDTASNVTAWANGVVSAASAAADAAARIEEAMSFTSAERDVNDPRYGLWFDGGNGGGLDRYMDRRVGDYQSYLDQLQNLGWGTAGMPTPSIPQGQSANAMLGMEDPAPINTKVVVDAESTKIDMRDAISGGMISGQGNPMVEVQVKLTMDNAEFAQQLKGMGTAYGTTDQFKLKITPDIAYFAEAIMSMSSAYGSTEGFKIKVTPDIVAFAERITTMSQSYGNTEGFKIKVNADTAALTETLTNLMSNEFAAIKISFEADTSALSETLTNLMSNEFAAIKITFEADTSALTQTLTSLMSNEFASIQISFEADTTALSTTMTNLMSNDFGSIKIPVELDAVDSSGLSALLTNTSFHVTLTTEGFSEAAIAAGNVLGILKQVAVIWTATIAQVGDIDVVVAMANVLNTGRAMAKTYTATIAQTGADGVISKMNDVKNAAEDMAGTYTATVNIVVTGLATLITAINAINNMPTSKSSTITLTTNNVVNNTVNTFRGGSAVSNTATGGMIGSAAMLGRQHDPSAIVPRARGGMVGAGEYTLVGELGPELVQLPVGSWVNTARQTSRMFRNQLNASRHFSSPPAPYYHSPGMATPRMYGPPSISRNEPQGSVNVNGNVTNNYNFHGDIVIGDKKAGDEFFAEIDRRMGRRTNLATRGMYPTDDTRPWT